MRRGGTEATVVAAVMNDCQEFRRSMESPTSRQPQPAEGQREDQPAPIEAPRRIPPGFSARPRGSVATQAEATLGHRSPPQKRRRKARHQKERAPSKRAREGQDDSESTGALRKRFKKQLYTEGRFAMKALRRVDRRKARKERALKRIYAGARIYFRERGERAEMERTIDAALEATRLEFQARRAAGKRSRYYTETWEQAEIAQPPSGRASPRMEAWLGRPPPPDPLPPAELVSAWDAAAPQPKRSRAASSSNKMRHN